MRILLQHGFSHEDPGRVDAEALVTAFLQQGHHVRVVASADRPPWSAWRRAAGFSPDIVIARFGRGALAAAWFARRRHFPLALIFDAPPGRLGPRTRFILHSARRVVAASRTLANRLARDGINSPIEVEIGGIAPPPAPLARCGGDRVVIGTLDGPPSLGAGADGRDLSAVDVDLLPIALAEIDVAVIATAPAWSVPRQVLHAMAAGCAIVAPDTPVLRECLDDGATALLHDPSDSGEPARAVARLVADAALRRRLGGAAHRRFADDRYDWPAVARRILAADLPLAHPEPCR